MEAQQLSLALAVAYSLPEAAPKESCVPFPEIKSLGDTTGVKMTHSTTFGQLKVKDNNKARKE